MSGINKVILVGHVGKDPEMKRFDNNVNLAKISLATTEVFRDKEGKRSESTEWHNVMLWRGLADVTEKYVRKGTQLFIEGRIRTRSWDDKDGKKRYATDVLADSMTLLGKKEDNPASRKATIVTDEANAMVSESAPTDNLPF